MDVATNIGWGTLAELLFCWKENLRLATLQGHVAMLELVYYRGRDKFMDQVTGSFSRARFSLSYERLKVYNVDFY